MSDIVERLRAKPDSDPIMEAWETGRPNDAARLGTMEFNLYWQAAAELERLRGLLREVGAQHRTLAGLFRGAQVPAGTTAALDSIERCVREALGDDR